MPTKYTIHTWADGFGLWHARVTGPVPVSDGFRQAASRAIRSELSERGDIAGYRLRLTVEDSRPADAIGYAMVTYREAN